MLVHHELLKHYIGVTKHRIKHAEKHGLGVMAMEEKAKLKKQERYLSELINAV